MRVIAGPEKKTRVMSEKERLITAYHEMGHAIVGHYLEHSDPVHKISVISRGQALGYTISMPQEDRFLTTRAELNDTMAMTLGGRAAEEIVFGEITTGASNDLEKVTATAKQMVMRFGMSEKLGPRVFGHDHGQPFLGREFSTEPDYSDEIAREIDDEVRRIVEAAHQRARDILTEHRQRPRSISEILVKRETIEKEEFIALLEGKSEEEVFGPTRSPRRPSCPPRRPRRPSVPAAKRRVRCPAPGSPAAPPTSAAKTPSAPSWPDADLERPGRLPPDGRRERDARLVLRRRAVPRPRRRGRAWAGAGAEGAEILDVGGESTRPGAEPVAAAEELRRVLPGRGGTRGGCAAAPHDLDRHLQGRRRRAPRWRPARRSSTTSPPCGATPRWRGSWRRAARSAA